ncbi:unnamed protein product [Mucor hiemalis]
MALSISTTNSVKPMAISTITSPPLPNSSLASSTVYHQRQSSSPHRHPFYPSTAPSPPESPTYRNLSNSQHQKYPQHHYHRHSTPYYNSGHYLTSDEQKHYRNSNSDNCLSKAPSMSPLQVAPLSLQQRRQRNKAASAKYRAKKNQQHGEMRSHILSLSKENDLLQRQLDHVRGENNRLKVTCDRLRGKMLAEKMLKNLLDGKSGEDDDEEEEDDENMELAEDYSILDDADKHDMQHKKEQRAAMLKRFDEDIEFDDEEEEDDDSPDDYQL